MFWIQIRQIQSGPRTWFGSYEIPVWINLISVRTPNINFVISHESVRIRNNLVHTSNYIFWNFYGCYNSPNQTNSSPDRRAKKIYFRQFFYSYLFSKGF